MNKEMQVVYHKCEHSVEDELSLEGQNYTPGTRGLRIPKLIQEKGVLVCCAILSVGFVLFIVLLSQSLKNDSDMSTNINLINDQLSQKYFNVSKEVSDTSLKIELIQAESRKELLHVQESAGSLLPNGNLTSVLEELAKLKSGIGRIAKDVVQVQEKLHNLTGDLIAKGDLTSVLEELAELKRENGGIAKDMVQVLGELYNLTGALMANGNLTSVLEELAELKSSNGRIAKDVVQVQEGLHNFTDFFCLSCPHNWQHFQRNCYFLSTLRGSWMSAKQSCEAEGARLVIINDKAEQTFLEQQMIHDQAAWIGLSDVATEGKWFWVDGTPLTLSFWRTGEPNNAGQKGEDCATLHPEGKWNDAICSNSDLWICERKC